MGKRTEKWEPLPTEENGKSSGQFLDWQKWARKLATSGQPLLWLVWTYRKAGLVFPGTLMLPHTEVTHLNVPNHGMKNNFQAEDYRKAFMTPSEKNCLWSFVITRSGKKPLLHDELIRQVFWSYLSKFVGQKIISNRARSPLLAHSAENSWVLFPWICS